MAVIANCHRLRKKLIVKNISWSIGLKDKIVARETFLIAIETGSSHVDAGLPVSIAIFLIKIK